MKKTIILISLCLTISFASMAQDAEVLTNKRGVAILPQAGDFALGIDASPLLDYVGNFFSDGYGSPTFDGLNKGTVFGKYFLQDDRAIRAKFSLGMGSVATKAFVRDDNKQSATPPETNFTLEDVRKYSNVNIDLGIGYEFRRGKGRVQGFYGGGAALGYSSSKYKYEYANAITSTRWNPTSTNFNNNVTTSSVVGGTIVTRDLERKLGSTFSFGLNGFVGVEYFFAPRLSIGGEYSLQISYALTGKSETTRENWSTTNNKIETNTTKATGTRTAKNLGLNTNASGGAIFLMFHF